MARCGSGALCTCALTDGCGTSVSGTGQAGVDPFQVNIAAGCPEAGDVIADYVGQHVDVGLTYNQSTHTLSTLLSSDQGNQLDYGTDGGLLYTGTCPDVSCCNTTVDGLPAAPGTVGGWDGAGKLVRAPGVVASYVQASRQRLDLTHMEVVALRDGTPVIYPDYGAVMSSVSDAPSGGPFDAFDQIGQWDAATWDKIVLQPSGPGYDPYGDPPTIDPAAGWAGMREPTQIGATFLGDVLERVGGRIVTVIGVTQPAAIGVRDELLMRCMQDSAIALVKPDESPTETAAVFANAQIPVGVRLDNVDAASNWPPQAVTELGATWVMAHQQITDARLTGYVDAGLQVLVHGIYRQVDADRVKALGVRGIVSDDPLYASGQVARYRTARDQWAYRTPGHGLLTSDTDTSPHWGATNRGYHFEDPNDPGYGLWVGQGYPAAGGRYAVLMGGMCPLPDTASYQLTFSVQWETASASGGSTSLGVAMCAADDRLLLAPGDGDHYLVGLSPNGDLYGIKYVSGQATDLGSVNIGAVSTSTWYRVQVTVAADGLTVTKTAPGGNQFFTSSDTELRGAFFGLHKSQVEATPYSAGFASVTYTPV